MIGYVLRRLGLAFITVWAISVLCFITTALPPGDFASNYVEYMMGGSVLGGGRDLVDTPEEKKLEDALRLEFGLDRPLFVQYAKWAWKFVRLDFGISIAYRRPVREVVTERLLMTVIVAATTAVFAWSLAIPIGIYTALRQHRWEDYTFTFIGFIGLAVPDFLLALLLMYLAYQYLDLSIGGLFSDEYAVAPWSVARVVDMLAHLWIVAIVVGTAGTAALIRVMRANLLDELNKPYVVTARAKGLQEWRIILKYPVRIALNPLVSTMGYLLPFLMSGSIIVSIVLSLPTEGPLLYTSLLNEDYFISATILFVLGALTVIGTLISDIALGILDPRIRYVGSR